MPTVPRCSRFSEPRTEAGARRTKPGAQHSEARAERSPGSIGAGNGPERTNPGLRSFLAAHPACSTFAGALLSLGFLTISARAEDSSPPAILQWFESSYSTIENRTPDLFMAGYGAVYTPPPGRA